MKHEDNYYADMLPFINLADKKYLLIIPALTSNKSDN
jgi:hypothetical protein